MEDGGIDLTEVAIPYWQLRGAVYGVDGGTVGACFQAVATEAGIKGGAVDDDIISHFSTREWLCDDHIRIGAADSDEGYGWGDSRRRLGQTWDKECLTDGQGIRIGEAIGGL